MRRLAGLTFLLAITTLAGCARRQAAPNVASLEPIPDGSVVLQRACTVCHNLAGLSAYAGSWGEPEWRDMVETMVSYGAMVTPREVDVLARYLAVNYGTEGDRPGENIGKLVQTVCTSCHALDVITARPREAYRDTIHRMMQYGAPVTEAQVDPLVEYLLETYGD